jgi:hypothetical protein
MELDLLMKYGYNTILISVTVDRKKVKLSLKQAVKAHRVVRLRGSHIF